MTRASVPMPAALAAFRLIYVAFIVTAGIETLIYEKAPGLPTLAGIPALMLLASVEILAAILFLFRRSEWWACAALLAVYAVATAISAAFGDWSLRFVYYGATALFIVMAARNLRGDAGHRLQEQ